MKTTHIEKRQYSEEIIDTITCDICGKTTKQAWYNGHYNTNETTIELHQGSYYPEGGSGEKTIFDICPDCFQDKLVPFLESLGAHPTTLEIDR